jgi:hypothetical protein
MTNVTSPAAAANAAGNGGTTELDTQLLKLLRAEVAQRRVRVEELVAELDVLKPELRRYERILAQLSDEPGEQAKQPGPKRRGRSGESKRARAEKNLGEEKLEIIRSAVIGYAKVHDEFRQVDIRAVVGEKPGGSVTYAFELLRQEGTIRLARQEKNSKYFRLTRQAAREAGIA